MNLKNRLVKLEQSQSKAMAPLLMIQNEDEWTQDQLEQMNKAQEQGRKILKIIFVGKKQNVDA